MVGGGGQVKLGALCSSVQCTEQCKRVGQSPVASRNLPKNQDTPSTPALSSGNHQRRRRRPENLTADDFGVPIRLSHSKRYDNTTTYKLCLSASVSAGPVAHSLLLSRSTQTQLLRARVVRTKASHVRPPRGDLLTVATRGTNVSSLHGTPGSQGIIMHAGAGLFESHPAPTLIIQHLH